MPYTVCSIVKFWFQFHQIRQQRGDTYQDNSVSDWLIETFLFADHLVEAQEQRVKDNANDQKWKEMLEKADMKEIWVHAFDDRLRIFRGTRTA